MPTPPLPVAELHCTLVAIVEHGSVSEAARQTGAARPALNHRAQQIRARWPGLLPEGQGNGLWAAGVTVPTLEEMEASDLHPRSAHRRAVSDLRAGSIPAEGFAVTKHTTVTDKHGDIVREFIQQKAEPGDTYEKPDGYKIKGESVLVNASGQTLARWIKTREEPSVEQTIEEIKAAFADFQGLVDKIAQPAVADADLLTLYPIADLHMGQMAWGRETGSDYDVSIATDIARRSMADLIERSPPSREAVILVLGDAFHQNDQKNETPRSKHRLDVDGRWSKVFRAGVTLFISLIKMAAEKHQSVEVVILPGNHDEDAAIALQVALGAVFSDTPGIRVNDTPGLLWYRRFGKCLFGANHGHTIRKFEQMAMAMAVDCREDWGLTEFAYVYCGHMHHSKGEEVGGVRVEMLTTPAAPDAYSRGSGYRAGRALSAITFHRECGEYSRQVVNIIGTKPRIRRLAGSAAA